jgi:protein-S-isoprenylcysteine O-methyltransferase Ste14
MNSVAEFVYRTAATRNRTQIVLSIVGAIFWYGVVATMVIISPLLDRLLGLQLIIPVVVRLPVVIVLLMVGAPMVVWTILRFFRAKGTPIPFNPPPVFVADGLYAHIRNPMHLGWTIVLVGLGIMRQSLSLLVILTPLFLLVHILYLKLVEEKELEKKFGQVYLDYKKRVPIWLPKLNPKS